jgi:protein-L-isoaspartate(D-aspartate) O-methyltransferase
MNNQNAGRHWRQVDLWCENWQAAEQMAVRHLWPLLDAAEHAGSITRWWFVRKGESWRLRLVPADDTEETAAMVLGSLTTALREQGAVRRCSEPVYEPEVHAFGGGSAMELAHTLFHLDSRSMLCHLTESRQDHRRELGLLLGTRLLRAAGLDWYEQGDVWTQLAAHRTPATPAEPSPRTVMAVQRLITAAGDTDNSPLTSRPSWPAAFDRAGHALADLNQQGHLTRGLRAVLAHHLLFEFNRLGISAEQQYLLATAAYQVVFRQEPASNGLASPSAVRHPTTVSAVISDTIDTTNRDPHELRTVLADHIRSRGTFRTAAVEAAFRTVPRHVFLPGVDLQTAYASKPVVTKRADDGTAISSASSPNLVAEMLEQLDVQPGDRVLEIGAATGINAALLAELVGPTGHVVTIELDDDLAAGARASLTAAGYPQVEVICGDGALGHLDVQPYDRIIVTAGAWDIAPAWWDQLAVGGRLVVPLRLHDSGLTRAIAFDLSEPGRMTSASAIVCGFVPLRGAAEHGESFARLADDVVLHLDAADLPDHAALSQALTYPAETRWTGIQIGDRQAVEHLDLSLLTTGAGNFGRLSVGRVARDSGLVDPALRWAGATLYEEGTLAYLAMRAAGDGVNELGVVGHGPTSTAFVGRVSGLLDRWDEERPAQPSIVAERRDMLGVSGAANHVSRPHTQVTIAW